ncbi:MAG: hypothetical protein D6801_07870 [Alphaproteobacteria bacterium]|nr:MAG: hypothetical protein D6801_07870 [Alphaproteobacteria bacterium]
MRAERPDRRGARRMAAASRALRMRLAALAALVGLVVIVALLGIARLKFDDELVRFFESDVPAHRDYAALGRAFEGDSNDIIALIEGRDVAEPEVARAVSDFVLDAQFAPGVRAVISPLALRLDDGPLFPFPPPDAAAMAARLEAARKANPMLSRMLSADRTAMLVILPIEEPRSGAQGRRDAVLAELGKLAARAEAAAGLRVRLSGYPVLRDEVARALMRDTIFLNSLGLAVGLVVAALTLRSLRLALLTLPGPLVALLFSVGLHGLLGITINSITVTLPVLIVVLATSDSIHVSFERGRQGGRDPARATMRAIRRVAVACILAAATTAMAFAALITSHSAIIAEMGRMGAALTLASVFIVLLTQFVVLTAAGQTDWGARLFERLGAREPAALGLLALPRLALRRPRLVTAASLAVLGAASWAYSQAGPSYSLLESLRSTSPVRAVFDTVEEKIAPVSQIHVIVNTTDPAIVGRVADDVARATGSPFVQSLASVPGGAETIRSSWPEALAHRLLSEDGTKALVSVPFRYVNGDQTLALAETIRAALADDPALEPGLIGAVTGLPVMSARVAGVILDEINRSLLIALAGVALLILVWLRSPRMALISLVPNMLPVALIGAWLMLSRAGIEFANALALTVAFGIAVDDTLHVLNRLALSGAVARVSRGAILRAYAEVSPALVSTTAVLFLGMAGSFLAENKSVAEFGGVAMSVLVLALLADLLVLPAVLAAFAPGSAEKRRKG